MVMVVPAIQFAAVALLFVPNARALHLLVLVLVLAAAAAAAAAKRGLSNWSESIGQGVSRYNQGSALKYKRKARHTTTLEQQTQTENKNKPSLATSVHTYIYK